MSTNSYIAEAATRHSVFLQRYGAGIALDQKQLITELAEDLSEKLFGALSAKRRKSRERIYSQLKIIIDASTAEMNKDVTSQLNDLAIYEGDFNLRMMNASVAVEFVAVQPAVLEAIVSTTKMTLTSGQKVTTGTLDDLYERFSSDAFEDVKRVIRSGIATRDTAEQISRNVFKKVNGTTRAKSKALVLTAANHVGQEAMNRLADANRDICGMDKYIATLDIGTTIACAGYDGKTFAPRVGPFPPIHYRCRSRRVAKVDDKYSIDIDGSRASKQGPVSSKLTYSGFLRAQSKEFQDEVLGVERAKLFRSGAVKLEGFTDDDNRVIPLSRLRELEGLTL